MGTGVSVGVYISYRNRVGHRETTPAGVCAFTPPDGVTVYTLVSSWRWPVRVPPGAQILEMSKHHNRK